MLDMGGNTRGAKLVPRFKLRKGGGQLAPLGTRYSNEKFTRSRKYKTTFRGWA